MPMYEGTITGIGDLQRMLYTIDHKFLLFCSHNQVSYRGTHTNKTCNAHLWFAEQNTATCMFCCSRRERGAAGKALAALSSRVGSPLLLQLFTKRWPGLTFRRLRYRTFLLQGMACALARVFAYIIATLSPTRGGKLATGHSGKQPLLDIVVLLHSKTVHTYAHASSGDNMEFSFKRLPSAVEHVAHVSMWPAGAVSTARLKWCSLPSRSRIIHS